MNRGRLLIAALAIGCLLVLVNGQAFAAGVRPLVIDISATPGDMVDFNLFLTPGQRPEKVNLSLYRPVQKLNGELHYDEADPKTYPPSGWVFIPAQADVRPGEETRVPGRIRVPFDAAGSNTVVIMVEPEIERREVGISFRIRYAVRLNIRVDRPGLRPSAEVRIFDMVRGENGEPVIRAQVANTSSLDYLTSAEVTIRDSRRTLVDRVELRPEASWRSQVSETRIYPYSELLYTGVPKEALTPGEYEMRLFFRYASGMQILQARTITIKAGDYVFPQAKLQPVRVTPIELDFEGRAGTVSSKSLRLENRTDNPITVVMEPQDLDHDYPYSLLKQTELEFRGGTQIVLGPRRTATIVITVRLPKDAVPAGSYALLRLKAYSANKELLQDSVVSLAATVAGPHSKKAELASVYVDRDGDGNLISVVLKNTGNVRLKPSVTAVVRDSTGSIAAQADLSVEGETNPSVLPDKLITLTGILKGLRPGVYSVNIRAVEGKENLISSTHTIEIK